MDADLAPDFKLDYVSRFIIIRNNDPKRKGWNQNLIVACECCTSTLYFY